jgi:hypothetical protein
MSGQEMLPLFAEQASAQEHGRNAYKWAIKHSDAFMALQRLVLELSRDPGVASISQGELHAHMVRLGWDMTFSRMFRRDRNLWPALARYMRAYLPEIKGKLAIRTSYLDDTTLPPMPMCYLVRSARFITRPIGKGDWE